MGRSARFLGAGALAQRVDDLRQDAHGDLLRRPRSDVEAGGTLNPVEGFRRDASRLERLAHLGEPLAARDDRQVVGLERQGFDDRFLVALAHRRDDGESARAGLLLGRRLPVRAGPRRKAASSASGSAASTA